MGKILFVDDDWEERKKAEAAVQTTSHELMSFSL